MKPLVTLAAIMFSCIFCAIVLAIWLPALTIMVIAAALTISLVSLTLYIAAKKVFIPVVGTFAYIMPYIENDKSFYFLLKKAIPTKKHFVKVLRLSKMYDNAFIVDNIENMSSITCPTVYLLSPVQREALRLGLFEVPTNVTLILTRKTKIKDDQN